MRIVAAAVATLALAGSGLAARSLQAPPLAGTDLVTGKRLSLADYPGRVVVINVWGAWCGGCITEAPDLARFARRHPGVALLGIDAEDSKPAARAFYRRYGLHHPSIFDPSGALARRLGPKVLPSTFFLNRKHQIVATIAGAGTLSGFEGALRIAFGS